MAGTFEVKIRVKADSPFSIPAALRNGDVDMQHIVEVKPIDSAAKEAFARAQRLLS